MPKPVFEFQFKGHVEMECVGGCGRTPRFVIIALPIEQNISTNDFPRIATCGKCEVVHAPKAKSKPESQDLEKSYAAGVKLGNALGDAFLAVAKAMTSNRPGKF